MRYAAATGGGIKCWAFRVYSAGLKTKKLAVFWSCSPALPMPSQPETRPIITQLLKVFNLSGVLLGPRADVIRVGAHVGILYGA